MDFVIYEKDDCLLIISEEWKSTSLLVDDVNRVLRRRGYSDTVVYIDNLLYYGLNNSARFVRAEYVDGDLADGKLEDPPKDVEVSSLKHYLKYPKLFDNNLVHICYDDILNEINRLVESK